MTKICTPFQAFYELLLHTGAWVISSAAAIYKFNFNHCELQYYGREHGTVISCKGHLGWNVSQSIYRESLYEPN